MTEYLVNTTQIPSALEITAITRAYPAVVTASAEENQVNTYQNGQLVKFTIPYDYGMSQLDNKTASVISVAGSNITVDIDTRGFDVFSVPIAGEQPASLSPAGSRNLSFNNTTRRVPFQSYNNRGN